MKKDLLESLVGKIIKVDRGGPNSRTGKLLSVANDYFTPADGRRRNRILHKTPC